MSLRVGETSDPLPIDSLMIRMEVPTVRRVTPVDRTAEMAWLSQPDPAFVGQWVALVGGTVVSHAAAAMTAYEEARRQGVEVPFMAFVSPPSEESFAGGWIR